MLLHVRNEHLKQEIKYRNQAEESLRKSEARYRTLFEETAISLWELDLSAVKQYLDELRKTGKTDIRTYFQAHPEDIEHCASLIHTLDVNKATLELYKASSREELFSNFHKIFCQKSMEGLMQGFVAIAEGAVSCQHETINRNLRGEPRSLMVEWTIVPEEETTYTHVLVSCIDITARKQAEREMHEKYKRLQRENQTLAAIAVLPAVAEGKIEDVARILTQSASQAINVERVGVWLFDESGTRLVNVDHYEAKTGIHSNGAVLEEREFRDEFAILKCAKCVDAHDALADPRTAGYVQGCLSPNRITSLLDRDIRIGERNLGILCFEHVDHHHQWEADESTFVGQLADQMAITIANRERKQAEESLLKTKALLEQTSRMARVGGWEKNLLTHDDHWSEITREIHEVPPDFIPDMNSGINFYKEGESREKIIEVVTQAIETGQPFDVELQIVTSKGRERWVRAIGSAEFQEGRCVRLYGTFQDIDDRKRTEEALRRLNDELELRVSQRTTELEAANRELQEFAYIVSHDLKAPLRGMNQLARWLQEDYAGVLGEQGQEQLDLLMNRVKRMELLIDGVLRYSRVTHGSEHEESIDLNTLAAQVIDMLAPPPHISIRIASPLPIVHGDPVQLTQVFQNLLNNAVKFMDKPDGKITVAVEDSGQIWTFQVEDNGPGIAPRHHKRIFQIFQTGAVCDTRESTGIGLTVVKKIVEFHGGRVWVESEPERGSRFSFTWPKYRED